MSHTRKPYGFSRKALLAPAALLAVLAAGCGGVEVEAARPSRGPIEESFTETARTRLSETWPVSMPIAGRIERITLEPGDTVSKGQRLVMFDTVPFEAALAEAREAVAQIEADIVVKSDNDIEETVLAEAFEWIKAAKDILKAADEEIAAEQARSDRAAKELVRMAELFSQKAVSQSELDDAQLAADTALIDLRSQQFTRAALNTMVTITELGPGVIRDYLDLKGLQKESLAHQLEQAKSRLVRAEHDLALTNIVSPVDGVVLARYSQGGATLAVGTDLLLLGDLSQMEVVADILTRDALKLEIGGPVELSPSTAAASISGKVKRIEPAGFTKLSSLGVEQQRVNTIVALDERPEDLGVGYQLQARFLTGTRADALRVPRWSVLEAPDRSLYVFKIVDGRLAKTPVAIGLSNDLELEITSGLSEGDTIVARPDTTLSDGLSVSVR